MLARLDAAIERERRFIAEASHELRSPLTILRGELELAREDGRSLDELRAAVASAADETDRLCRLADDLLLIARSQDGELPLRLERLDAPPLLEGIAARFRDQAADRGRSLLVEAAPGLTLTGDRTRLEQALGNLVDNALRHGAGDVTLSAAAAVAGLTGCGSSSGSSGSTSAATSAGTSGSGGSSPAAEAKATAGGDIPDNQVFLTFHNKAGGYSLSYPEGWTRKVSGSSTTFTDKDNSINASVIA